MLKSKRGIPLVFQEEGFKRTEPVLTVENYTKWYELFIVMPDRSVVAVEEYDHEMFDKTWPRESTWGDHIPNPRWVLWLAAWKGWIVDERSLEIITGRWVIDHEGRYDEMPR